MIDITSNILTLLSIEGFGLVNSYKLLSSLESIRTDNIIEALNRCSELLEKYGGHKSAAGFTIKANNLLKLEEKLNNLSEVWFSSNGNSREVSPECHLKFSDITESFIDDYNKLEPFGIGNLRPIFWSRHIKVIKSIFFCLII